MFNINALLQNPQFMRVINAKNPKQLLSQIAANSNNPMLKHAMELMQSGDSQGIEQYARNILKSSGQNPDDIYNAVKGIVNMKKG